MKVATVGPEDEAVLRVLNRPADDQRHRLREPLPPRRHADRRRSGNESVARLEQGATQRVGEMTKESFAVDETHLRAGCGQSSVAPCRRCHDAG